jgi:hypothetical protein
MAALLSRPDDLLAPKLVNPPTLQTGQLTLVSMIHNRANATASDNVENLSHFRD